MDAIRQELRYALRQLARSPGFAAVAILTLALGIGATTAIFSVLDGVLLRPAPFPEADELVVVWATDRSSGTLREPASDPDYLDFREQVTRFAALAAFSGIDVSLEAGTGPVRIPALRVTHQFLPMVGIRPVAGRAFTPADDRVGAPDVVLIADRLRERLFGPGVDPIGATIRLDDRPHAVVGVVPEEAAFGARQVLGAADYARAFADRGGAGSVQLWVPLRPDPAAPRSTHGVFVLGRLGAGADRASAQQELDRIAADLETAYGSNADRGVFVEPLPDVVFGPLRPAMLLLVGAVALVLLVACANVASLLLTRGAAGAREVALRRALGASGLRLARQFLAESLLLVAVAAVIGVGLALLGLDAIVALAPPDVPRLDEVGIDLRVLAATLLVSATVALAFGALPSLQARRTRLRTVLATGESGRTSAGRRAVRVRSGIVVAQLALAVVLVVSAGLLIKSFRGLQQVDPGFQSEAVLKAEYQLPATRYPVDFGVYPDLAEIHGFNRELLRRVEALPGVESAAIATAHPMAAGFTNSFVVVGREAEADDWPEIAVRMVTPGYLPTLGVPLRRGRALRDADDSAAQAVLLINQAAADRFFPAHDPLGQQIAFWGTARTVVGVVGNERFRGLREEAPPAVYVPLAQAPPVNGAETLLVRTAGGSGAVAADLRRVIQSVDAGLAVWGLEPLDETVAGSVARSRFVMTLLTLFGGLAMLLGAVGIYGVVASIVSQRTREIGIRMALGARPGRVLGMVIGGSGLLIAAGLALGLLGAAAAGRLLAHQLHGVATTDPAVYALAALALGAVGLLSSWVPARRAAGVDPAIALRQE